MSQQTATHATPRDAINHLIWNYAAGDVTSVTPIEVNAYWVKGNVKTRKQYGIGVYGFMVNRLNKTVKLRGHIAHFETDDLPATTDRVIIRAFKGSDGKYTDTQGRLRLDAFIVDASANYGRIVCCGRVQEDMRGLAHSEASLDYYQSTRAVDYNDPEAQHMIGQLREIGYVPRLVKKLIRPFGGWAK